jgi:hypothetical protein
MNLYSKLILKYRTDLSFVKYNHPIVKESNLLIINLSIRDHSYTLIDFDFVELRFASVLLLPLPQGERRTEFPQSGTSSAQPKSIYSPWGWGK